MYIVVKELKERFQNIYPYYFNTTFLIYVTTTASTPPTHQPLTTFLKEGILGMAALKPRPSDPSESSPKPSRVSSSEEMELIFSILVWGPATVSVLFSRTTLWACSVVGGLAWH